jgi:hypothetical protein
MDTSKEGLSDHIERWLARVPVIGTYRDREQRRETDKRLREHLASRLTESKETVQRTALDLAQRGKLAHLDDVDRLASHIQQMADTIRYASYGYSGIFALEKIREEALDRLYAFDLSLMEDIDGIQATVSRLDGDMSDAALSRAARAADESVTALENKFRQRKDVLSTIT